MSRKTSAGGPTRFLVRLGTLVALIVTVALVLVVPAESAGSKPNIVFILADDMGYGDPGCYNAESKTPTPNIDRLAAQGMRFTDAHAPGAVCVPTRYGLLTGRYPFRTQIPWSKRALIEPGRMTLASLLRENGYATAMVGKWHLGFEGGPDYQFSEPFRGGPIDHGFDTYFGMAASLDQPPYYWLRDNRAVEPPSERIEASSSPGWSPVQGAFWRAGGVTPGFRHADVLSHLTKEAIRYLETRAAANDEKPFFLYVALTAPHTPWLPTKQFAGQSRAGMYGDFVMQVDSTVGQIVDALDAHQPAERTLVIFASDNGPVWYPRDVDRFDHRSVGPLRGMKGDAWEGGHRMPLIARWTNRVRPGSVCHETICFTDFLTTFASIVGTTLPDGAGEDSYNILPAMLGKTLDRPIRDVTILKHSATVIRQGPWKLITHLGSGGLSGGRSAPKPDGPRGQLYDLKKDLGETNNLWSQHPEVVARLSRLLAESKRRGRSRTIP